MRPYLLLTSVIVVLFSIAFKDKIIYLVWTLPHRAPIIISIIHLYHSTTHTIDTPNTANMTIPRAIRKAFLAIEQSEGAGARVRRSIGTPQLRNLPPFLMLDHFTVKPGAGFPDHPHR